MTTIDEVEVIVLGLPMAGAWRSAHGELTTRRTVLVRVRSRADEGWGECVALEQPGYTTEWVDGAALVLRRELAPALLAGEADEFADLHPMASTAVEAAVTDLELRRSAISLATHLGASKRRVPAGIVIGLEQDSARLRERVDESVASGYRRVKLKIEPGRDAEWVGAVRTDHPDLDLWVDGNGAYEAGNAEHQRTLHALDELGLGLIEQPFDANALDEHARLAALLATPICLDEPLLSLRHTIEAVERGACSVVNLKPARVGGWREAQRIVAWCSANAVDCWIGGMIESGIGRAANLAFAALDGVTLPGDLSPSSRFFPTDVVRPEITMHDGWIDVPSEPGLGVDIDRETIDRFTESRMILT